MSEEDRLDSRKRNEETKKCEGRERRENNWDQSGRNKSYYQSGN